MIIQKQSNEIESLREMLKIAHEKQMPSKNEAAEKDSTYAQQLVSLKM